MTWSTLPTYTDGTVLDASKLNAIKANINETAPAKATTAGYHFVSTGTNHIEERAIVSDKILTQQTTTSTTYTNLSTTGGIAALTTGVKALIMHGCQMFNDTTSACWSSYELSGATSSSPNNDRAVTCEANANDSFRMSYCELQVTNPGVNVFIQKYRVSAGQGTFDDRHIIAMGL